MFDLYLLAALGEIEQFLGWSWPVLTYNIFRALLITRVAPCIISRGESGRREDVDLLYVLALHVGDDVDH